KQQYDLASMKTDSSTQTSDTLHHIQAAQQRTAFQLMAETLGRVADNVSVVTRRWVNGQMSNFAYLMFLNTLAGRSYNDITQYPVFPWILRDYESETLNLSNPAVYRDLSKPMGAQTESRASEFKKRFETWDDPTGKIPPWHYGSHYSCAAIVLYFLIRLEPFTKIALELQDGKFDHADRLFSSIPYSWQSASDSGGMQDVKELIPEFFYSSHFLMNINRFNFHKTEKKIAIDDVLLPCWACGDPERFIRLHREALESPYVSQNLHHWIDLIFGYKQRGDAAVESLNVFYYLTYEGAEDLEAIEDQTEKESKIAHINNFWPSLCLIVLLGCVLYGYCLISYCC
ncbi:BEACH domain-containing protein, partial [Reticulomyxa filosa]